MRPVVARYRLFFSLSNLFFGALYTVQCDFKTLNWILVASGIMVPELLKINFVLKYKEYWIL